MKAVKTVNGLKRIEDTNPALIPMQLQPILQEHRSTLIEKLLHGGLDTYIDYKFSLKVSPKQLDQIRLSLQTLKQDAINMEIYATLFDSVMGNDFTHIDSALFYLEIDEIIQQTISQPRLFPESQKSFYHS